MAVILGTNAGFVTTAPTADPSGLTQSTHGRSSATKDTSPVGAVKVIEIGWWADNATPTVNFEVGIYDHNAGDDEPENLLSGVDRTNSTGGTTGWKRVTGLNIAIDAETIYWIAFQIDTSNFSDTNRTQNGGRSAQLTNQTTLIDPWGTTDFLSAGRVMSIYAITEAAAGFTRKIKISGTFQDKPIKTKVAGTFEDKPIKIKVGGTFQDA